MIPSRHLPAGMLAIAVALQGCAVTESENIKTSGISAHIEVMAKSSNPNSKTRVSVNLQSGSGIGGTDLELSDGDRLYVTVDGERYRLSKSDNVINTEYDVEVPTTSTHSEFIVSFERDNDTSAPSSTAMLPEPFTINPLTKSNFEFGENIPLTWTPSGTGKIQVFYNFVCQTQSGENNAYLSIDSPQDDGSYTLDLSDVMDEQEDGLIRCGGEIRLQRSQNGSLDSNYGEGGSIKGIQERSLSIDVS